jgi:hypothetical protein
MAGDNPAQLAANPITDSPAQASARMRRFIIHHVAHSPLRTIDPARKAASRGIVQMNIRHVRILEHAEDGGCRVLSLANRGAIRRTKIGPEALYGDRAGWCA